MAECIRCKQAIGGFLGVQKALPMTIESAIQCGVDPKGLCEQCLQDEIDKSRNPALKEAEAALQNAMESIIISTTAHPAEWTKDIVGIVNGFSVIGTGLLAEVFSTVTDILGAESNTYHGKLTYAKNKAILRAKAEALTLGANMIFGLQVNITEISAMKGMLLVAVTGTALKHNIE